MLWAASSLSTHGCRRRRYRLTFTTHSPRITSTQCDVDRHGVFIAGFSSSLPGLTYRDSAQDALPRMTGSASTFLLGSLCGSILMVLGTPVLAIAIVLLALERTVGIGVFDPTRGRPLLFNICSGSTRTRVYIMILPGMGVISETSLLQP